MRRDGSDAEKTDVLMMRAFGAGRVVITSDLSQCRHFDQSFCWRIPVDPTAEAPALLDAASAIESIRSPKAVGTAMPGACARSTRRIPSDTRRSKPMSVRKPRSTWEQLGQDDPLWAVMT